ncbi:hypothetical protein [Dietzia sp. Alg238-R159]|uniref:hypothetical protein n=1 Tax=Dietzia sp. Alg238-R159 TaxID=2305986 RepID=UPI0013D426D0|nr:hypothetical protein [Dietzia sp. Alg238-R159]
MGLLLAFVIALVLAVTIIIAITAMPTWFKVVLASSAVVRLLYAWLSLQRNGVTLDAGFYHLEAKASVVALQFGIERPAASVFLGKEGWPILLEQLYRIVGPHPFAGLAINVAAVTLLSVVVYQTSSLLRLTQTARVLASACALLPQFTLWSSLLLREAITWLAIATITYCALRLTNRAPYPWAGATGLAASMAVLFSFRASVGVALGVSMLLFIVLSRTMTVGIKIAAVVAALFVAPFVLGYLDESKLLDPERLDMSRAELSAATTGFSTGGGDGLGSQLLTFPVSLLRVLVGPFPWEIIGLGPVAAGEWLFWIILLAPALAAIHKRPRGAGVLVFVSAAIMIALAFSITNYGTLARLRIMALVPLLPLIGIAWDNRRAKRGGQQGTPSDGLARVVNDH